MNKGLGKMHFKECVMIHENCDFVNISSLLSLYILESIIREIKGVFIWISRAQDPA